MSNPFDPPFACLPAVGTIPAHAEPVAEMLRGRIEQACRDIYDNYGDREGPEFKRAIHAYDQNLAGLCALYGGEDRTPAWEDPDLYEVFHNVWKSDYGTRPRFVCSITFVRDWLESRREQ